MARSNPCQGKEMLDNTVLEKIKLAFNKDLDLISGIDATYDILYGEHYDLSLKGYSDCQGGSKGVLDYLIFPLVARKLIADTFLLEDENHDRNNSLTKAITNVVSWTIALPLEAGRFAVAVLLTLILAPIVALVHLIRACLPKKDIELSDSSKPVLKSI